MDFIDHNYIYIFIYNLSASKVIYSLTIFLLSNNLIIVQLYILIQLSYIAIIHCRSVK